MTGPDRTLYLYPSCKLVRGSAYSAIYDLERKRLHRFSSQYFRLFSMAAGEDGLSTGIVEQLNGVSRAIASSAIDYLVEHELVSDGRGRLAEMTVELASECNEPRAITSAIIDVDDRPHDFAAIIRELDACQCPVMQVRSYGDLIGPEEIDHILRCVAGSTVQRLELLLRHSEALANFDWPRCFDVHQYLTVVQLHGAPSDRVEEHVLGPGLPPRLLAWRTDLVTGPQGCGAISLETLNLPNVALFNELRQFNGCLNRKLSIRSDGQICNCPSLPETYGSNVSAVSQIVKSAEFQDWWKIDKDSVEVCRDCEFRYVCTDCRANTPGGARYAKPVQCTYDPETGRWGE